MGSFIQALLSQKGDISTMRVMSLTSLLIGALIAVYGVYMGKDLGGIAQLCAVFVGAAFCGKAGQKFMEKSED